MVTKPGYKTSLLQAVAANVAGVFTATLISLCHLAQPVKKAVNTKEQVFPD
jgi:hypothetical protein